MPSGVVKARSAFRAFSPWQRAHFAWSSGRTASRNDGGSAAATRPGPDPVARAEQSSAIGNRRRTMTTSSRRLTHNLTRSGRSGTVAGRPNRHSFGRGVDTAGPRVTIAADATPNLLGDSGHEEPGRGHRDADHPGRPPGRPRRPAGADRRAGPPEDHARA